MKNYIKSFRLFEAQGSVQGLDEFMKRLNEAFPEHPGVLDDLESYIVSSGCPAIAFETLYGAQGISKTDKCIVSDQVLKSSIEKALYVILHEISHQYQYAKYGKNVMWDAYNSRIDIEQAVDLLMNIELVADRLAVLKTAQILRSNRINDFKPVTSLYKNLSRSYFKSHLEGLRKAVTEKGVDSIEGANEILYNKLKEKPKVFTEHPNRRFSPPRKSEREIKIDAILDKISATGWESLTADEKNYLRSQSR
jgi:hypothetical protein